MAERKTWVQVVAGCKRPPVLLSGKERLDFVTPAIQPLVVMDWLLAAATGRDALPGQHLGDFVAVIPLLPNHRGGRRRVLEHPISTSEVALSLTQVEPSGTAFAVADPMERAGHAPLGATSQAGVRPPLLRLDAVGWGLKSVASIIRTSDSVESDGSAGSDTDNSEKIRSKTPLPDQQQQRL